MSTILDNFFNRKRIKIVIAIAIVLLIIYPFVFQTKKSFADEISLFPTRCEGSWSNASEAAGDPADNRLIGAQSGAVGDMLTCHSFDASSLPEGAVITNAHLEFLWVAGDDQNKIIEPSIEESYDPIAPLTEEDPTIQETEIKIIDIETISPEDQKTVPEPLEIDSSNSNIDTKSDPESPSITEPTSRLPNWIYSLFIPEAQAEEKVVIPEENVESSSENNTKINDEQTTVPETNQKDIGSEKDGLSGIDANEVLEGNITSSDTPSEQSENNSEIEIKVPKETEEVGTALYDIAYTISDNKSHSLGYVTREHLSKLYPIPLTLDDIILLKVSLTSLLTFDQIDNLALESIKLVVVYSYGDSLDPIRQPDLEVDTVVDDVIVDNIQAIRIKRDDNKQYEIWYRVLDPEELIKNSIGEEINTNDEKTIYESPEILITNSSDLAIDVMNSKEKYVTETVTSIKENRKEEVISTPTNTIDPEIPLDSKILDKKKRFYWNYVDGDDSVNRAIPVALQDGYIFWLNKKGTVLNSFNILTQGYNSQSYQPENEQDFIKYYSPSSQEKRAILNFSEQKFIFSE